MKSTKAAAAKLGATAPQPGIAKLAGADFAEPRAARCGQCSKVLRHLPFAIDHIICRECYGLDRYRRQSLVPPGASAEPVVSVAPRTALVENPAPKAASAPRRAKTAAAETS